MPLLKPFKNLFRKESSYIYVEKYDSLEEARSISKNTQDYGNKKYDKRSISKLSFDEKYTNGRNLIIPTIISTNEQQKIWRIIDIGGGVNSIFSHLNHRQKSNTQCFVLEREEVSSKLNEKVPEKYRNNLFYTSDINQINISQLDIAYFGSSIQYIENHQALLLEIFSKTPRFIIFSESIFTDEENDYYVLQTNMGSSSFPNRFTSQRKIDHFLNNNGYTIVLNLAIPGPHTHESIDRSTYECRTLIYQRSTNSLP